MKQRKKIFLITVLVLVCVLVFNILASVFFAIFFFNMPAIFMISYAYLQPNPPKPEITYGEFPFEIVYSIDGEIITVNDIYVCEYDGIEMGAEGSKYRKWKSYVKSTGEEDLILLEDGNLKFGCDLNSPKHYMGDLSDPNDEFIPNIHAYTYTNESGGRSYVSDVEPLLSQYKLKLISWKFSEPIENSFKYSNYFKRGQRHTISLILPTYAKKEHREPCSLCSFLK